MKKTFLTLTVVAFMATTIFIGCDSPQKDVEDARENLADAKEDLAKAKQDSIRARQDSVAAFKKSAADKINANEIRIAELKADTKKQNQELRDKNEKKIIVLEQKNRELKAKSVGYDETKERDWEAFKAEFNKQMDDLERATDELIPEKK